MECNDVTFDRCSSFISTSTCAFLTESVYALKFQFSLQSVDLISGGFHFWGSQEVA